MPNRGATSHALTALRGGLVSVACAASVACLPETFENTEELNVIATVRDPSRDFSDFDTYWMSDMVIDLSQLTDDPIEIGQGIQDLMLDTVAEEMAALGYRRIEDDGSMPDTDVAILVGAVAGNNWVLTGYYPWYGFPGYWYYYPPVAVPINYPTGSVIITMLRPSEVSMDEEDRNVVATVWAAGMRSVLQANTGDTRRAVVSNISQAFAQSPYLRTGPPLEPPSAGDAGVEGGG